MSQNKKLLDLSPKEYANMPMEEFRRRLAQEQMRDIINRVRRAHNEPLLGEQ
jgi:hypothetical protein